MQSSDKFKTFEEVFSWSQPADILLDRTILFTVPGWWLYIIGTHHEYLYYAHGCCESFGGDRWGISKGCVKCGELPPDEIITIATLYSKPRISNVEDRC
jgi:hypothetical protein